jgi:hypothetical protein
MRFQMNTPANYKCVQDEYALEQRMHFPDESSLEQQVSFGQEATPFPHPSISLKQKCSEDESPLHSVKSLCPKAISPIKFLS